MYSDDDYRPYWKPTEDLKSKCYVCQTIATCDYRRDYSKTDTTWDVTITCPSCKTKEVKTLTEAEIKLINSTGFWQAFMSVA